jgi:HEAT repeat protein
LRRRILIFTRQPTAKRMEQHSHLKRPKRRFIRTLAIFPLGVGSIVLLLALFKPASEPRYEGKPVSFWFEGLDGPNARTQDAFTELGSNAVPYLMKQLKTQQASRMQRFYASQILPRAPRIFNRWLSEPVDLDNLHAVAAFGFVFVGAEGVSAVPELLDMVRDEDFRAVDALGAIGPAAGPEAKTLLRKGIQSTNDGFAADCLRALAHICLDTNDDLPDLIAGLQSKSLNLRAGAAMGFETKADFGNPKDLRPAIPILIGALSDEFQVVRFRIVRVFTALRCPSITSNAMPSLLDLFNKAETLAAKESISKGDANPLHMLVFEKLDIVEAMIETGAKPRETISFLSDVVQTNTGLALRAAWLLSRIDPHNQTASEVLLQKLRSAKTGDELENVICYFGLTDNAQAFDRLRALQHDSRLPMRLWSTFALHQMNPTNPAPLDLLVEFVKGRDVESNPWASREFVCRTFDLLGQKAIPAIPKLQALTNSPSRRIRLLAAECLKRIKIRTSICDTNKNEKTL